MAEKKIIEIIGQSFRKAGKLIATFFLKGLKLFWQRSLTDIRIKTGLLSLLIVTGLVFGYFLGFKKGIALGKKQAAASRSSLGGGTSSLAFPPRLELPKPVRPFQPPQIKLPLLKPELVVPRVKEPFVGPPKIEIPKPVIPTQPAPPPPPAEEAEEEIPPSETP